MHALTPTHRRPGRLPAPLLLAALLAGLFECLALTRSAWADRRQRR